MTHDPHESSVDLEPIDAWLDEGADRFTASVMGRIRTIERRPDADPLAALWGMWRGLALAGAALLVLLFVSRGGVEASPPRTVAESLGVPPEFQALMSGAPSEGGGR